MTTASSQPKVVSTGAIAIRWRVALPAAREGHATLEVRGDSVLRVLLRSSGAERELARASAMWARDGDLVHLDAPGVLHATLRDDAGGLRVLYARCPALDAPGGTYELIGAAWDR